MNDLIKVYVLVSFYDERGLHKAGTITEVPEEEFNPMYMKKIDVPSGGGSLEDLSDVDISSVDDGQILMYDAATEKWINATGGGGSGSVITNIYEDGEGHVESMEIDGTEYEFGTGETTIDESSIQTDSNGKVSEMSIDGTTYEFTSVENVQTDSNDLVESIDINSTTYNFSTALPIENPVQSQTGKLLSFDYGSDNFEIPALLEHLEDIYVSGASDGDVLAYDAQHSTWVATTPSGGVDELVDLDDVAVSSPSNGQVLTYNSTSQKWENANAGGGGGGSSLVVTLTGAYSGITIDLATMAPNSNISVSADSTYAAIKATDDIIFKIVDTTQAGSKYTLRPTGMHTLNVSADQTLIFTFSVITPSSNTPKVFKLEIGPWGTNTFACVA